MIAEINNLRATGDHLQSEGSRLAEWVLEQVAVSHDVPYEVHMAALEVVTAVKAWTEIRRHPSV